MLSFHLRYIYYIVGATYVDDGPSERIIEIGANFSSGGFSTYQYRPSFQDKAVNDYFKTSITQRPDIFDRNGRAYPDVSAVGK